MPISAALTWQMADRRVYTWRLLRLRSDRMLATQRYERSADRLSKTLPGIHTYFRLSAACSWGTGTFVYHAVLTGDIRLSDGRWLEGDEQTILWGAHAGPLFRAFAIDLAERYLIAQRESGRVLDARLWHALTVRRAWLAGRATDRQWFIAKRGVQKAHEESAAKTNAANTILQVDASLPRGMWRITRDAAIAIAGMRGEHGAWPYVQEELYEELEQRLTDAFGSR